jgi:hypothetical protein
MSEREYRIPDWSSHPHLFECPDCGCLVRGENDALAIHDAWHETVKNRIATRGGEADEVNA